MLLAITIWVVRKKEIKQQTTALFTAKNLPATQLTNWPSAQNKREIKQTLQTSIFRAKKEFSFPPSNTSTLFSYLLLSWHPFSFSKWATDAIKAEQFILTENSHPVSKLMVFLNYQILPLQRDWISHITVLVTTDGESSPAGYLSSLSLTKAFWM